MTEVTHHEFLSLSQELAAPGEMRQAQTFDFAFKNVEKQYESYQGINVKLRCVTVLAGSTRSHREQVLHSGDDFAASGRGREREGYLGSIQTACHQIQQLNQDGSWA